MLRLKQKVVLLSFSSFYLHCSAQEHTTHKHYITAGLIAGRQFPESLAGGGFAGGGFYFDLLGKQAAIDFSVREIISTPPLTQATLLTATFRLPVHKGLFIGIGGSHAHQIGMDHYIEHPVAVSAGNHPSIIHSSGFCIEAGYLFKPIFHFKKAALYPIITTSSIHLFALKESWLLLSTQLGVRLGFNTYQQGRN